MVDRLWGLFVERIWRPYPIRGKRENVLHVSENAISAQKITKNRPTTRARFDHFSQKGALAVGRDLSKKGGPSSPYPAAVTIDSVPERGKADQGLPRPVKRPPHPTCKTLVMVQSDPTRTRSQVILTGVR